MSLDALWSAYMIARERYLADPSPQTEGALIATYAEWARAFCTNDADLVISEFIRKVQRATEDMSRAA